MDHAASRRCVTTGAVGRVVRSWSASTCPMCGPMTTTP